MESPEMLEESYFWFHRNQNGWPPVPEAMLAKAEQSAREAKEAGKAFTFCGVPVQELTEREAKAALVILMAERFAR